MGLLLDEHESVQRVRFVCEGFMSVLTNSAKIHQT
jgi:hypothetical protein